MHGDTSWHWEARSVNGRTLDLRLRLPSGFEALEIRARGLAQEKLARGNCTINLWVKRETGRTEIRLNETALRQAQAVAERAKDLDRAETCPTRHAARHARRGGNGGRRKRARKRSRRFTLP